MLEHPGAWPRPKEEVPTMQAYAHAERLPQGTQFRTPDPAIATGASVIRAGAAENLIDQLVGHLADLVVDRLMERTAADVTDRVAEWLNARGAADYLGVHPDTLRKLAAQRAVPTHQDGPRCKLYFRRDELDEWRRSTKSAAGSVARLRAV